MDIQAIIAEFGASPQDSGAVEVQCAILTQKINNLTIHLKKNKKDHQTRRGLIAMVSQRNALVSYLKRKNIKRYEELIAKLNLKG
jgi:small subunit ribosomal protein S15